jgi:trehalose 6-phosphate synthase
LQAAGSWERDRAFVAADALNAACQLPHLERKMRMRKLRENVRRNNISGWVDAFLAAAFSRHLEDFTVLETVQFHEKRPAAQRNGAGQ